MAVVVKKHKPTSPGRRGLVTIHNSELHKGPSYGPLTEAKTKNTVGRNHHGRITMWQRGGGHKQKYRLIDFKRNKDGIKAKVERIEHDPNRTPYIALVLYTDGERRYIIAPKGLSIGSEIESGRSAAIATGNTLPLVNIPIGTVVHGIEMRPGKGAQIARSAGTSAQLLAREGRYATLRLKSGEMRKILAECRATIGEVSKSEHNLRKLGKAGRSRWMNKRPHVRGVAMNPVDHPLGGGEGRSSGGRPPCSPWGLAEGKKTRQLKKNSSKFIVRRRKRKSEK
ncbi:MAG: 50S ribosomal protein L2 [Francisellaceae bacterium]|jgi:large subunit ribosomal protein L2|nr:50S ribosomal protein L2 [Francisellaceae bacterium]MBT6539126.1 50S ribosomal protein L2 [Francisellaceae bacterium]